MAKLKIGEAVSEVKDIKIDDVEAQGVSGVIDNSRNWTSITIGDTTGTIPAGSSGLEDRVTALEEKLDGVHRTETGLKITDQIEFDDTIQFDGAISVDATINAYDIIHIDDEASLFQEEGRVGQYVGEEGEFKKFSYVEEVETNYIITAGDITEVIPDVLWKVTLDVSALNLGKGKILAINSTSITAEYIPLYVCRVEDETISVLGFLCDEDPLDQTINNISILR